MHEPNQHAPACLIITQALPVMQATWFCPASIHLIVLATSIIQFKVHSMPSCRLDNTGRCMHHPLLYVADSLGSAERLGSSKSAPETGGMAICSPELVLWQSAAVLCWPQPAAAINGGHSFSIDGREFETLERPPEVGTGCVAALAMTPSISCGNRSRQPHGGPNEQDRKLRVWARAERIDAAEALCLYATQAEIETLRNLPIAKCHSMSVKPAKQ